MKTKIFTLFLALVACVGNMFAEIKIGDLYYNLDATNHTAEVTSQNSSYPYWSTSITTANIPASVTYKTNTYSVTSIGKSAFYKCSSLTSVTIPNSVTSIGDYAFEDCSGLTSVTIGNSVTSIGSLAFSGCSGLTSVTIPNSVTSIGEAAFSHCTGLTKVNITDIAAWCNIAFGDYGGNPLYSANHLYVNDVEVTNLVIPEGVTSIGECAFFGCTGLTSVTIGNSVTSIGNHAFAYCTGLTSVTIGNSVTSIGGWAFLSCTSLSSVTIGNSVTSIGERAFYKCNNITSVIWNAKNCAGYNFGSQVTSFTFGDEVEVIPEGLCERMEKLTSITIPESVTSIGASAFWNCTGLTKVNITDIAAWCNIAFSGYGSNPLFYAQHLYVNDVEVTNLVIPEGVTSIGDYAFSGCSGLTSVTIGNSVTSIGDYAFKGCSGLTSVTIPNSVTSIGDYAFYDCTGLTSVTIPNSVTSIEDYAFAYCTGLTSITIPNSVTRIESSAFLGCTGLTSVTIGNSVTSIGDYAFYGCKGLTSVTIGNSVTSIGDYAFKGCSGLTSVTIPNSVTSIGNYAFRDCTGLTSVTIGNSVTSIGDDAFDGCTGLTSVTIESDAIVSKAYTSTNNLKNIFGDQVKEYIIGNSVTSIGNYAFRDCSGLTSVTIGNSVTSIGDDAFWNCSGLTKVNITDIAAWCNIAFGDYGGNPLLYAHHLYVNDVEVTNLVIPESVTSIGNKAFEGCTGLTSVTIPNSVTSIGDDAFEGCTGLTSVTIGNSVTSIGDYAFYGCKGLTSVTIPNSVTSIGDYAFKGCSGLTSVTIPNSVTSIGDYAFYMVKNINYTGDATGGPWGALSWNNKPVVFSTTQIKAIATSLLGNNQTSEDYYLFTGVISSISEVSETYGNATFYVSDGKTSFYCYRIHDYYSTNFTSSSQLHVGDSVVISSKLYNYYNGNNTYEATQGHLTYHSANPLFTPDEKLYYGVRTSNSQEAKLYFAKDTVTLNIPGKVTYNGQEYTVTEIASSAIYNVPNIQCVTLPSTLKYMPKAFEKCATIQTLYYNPINLSAPTTTPFASSSATLQNVYVGEEVTSIPNGFFDNLSNVINVEWNTVQCEDLTKAPFYSSRATIKNFTLPENITRIPAYLCNGITSFKELTLPSTVTAIGNYAFANCSNLTSLILPENVSTYGTRAFANCTSLKAIYNYRTTPAKLATEVFEDVDYFNCMLYVPVGSVDMYKSSGSDWKNFYYILPMGASATTLTTREVVVEAGDNSALFIWPVEQAADSYTLEITKDGVVFCTLTFDGMGRLTGIAFVRGKEGAAHSPAAIMTEDGMQFTVTGLETAANYAYSLQVKDASSALLASYSGVFGTTGADQAIDQITNNQCPMSNKVIKDGQIYILRGDKTYTLTGQEVK